MTDTKGRCHLKRENRPACHKNDTDDIFYTLYNFKSLNPILAVTEKTMDSPSISRRGLSWLGTGLSSIVVGYSLFTRGDDCCGCFCLGCGV